MNSDQRDIEYLINQSNCRYDEYGYGKATINWSETLENEGCFGVIFFGVVEDPHKSEIPIVVKALKGNDSDTIREYANEFRRQSEINKKCLYSAKTLFTFFKYDQYGNIRQGYTVMKRARFTLQDLCFYIFKPSELDKKEKATVKRNIKDFFDEISRSKEGYLATIFRMIGDFLEALRDLHKSGYIHQDIKPDNVFVDKELQPGDQKYHLLLADFGYARFVTGSKTNVLFSNNQMLENFKAKDRCAHAFFPPEVCYDFGYPYAYPTSDMYSAICVIYSFLYCIICKKKSVYNPSKLFLCSHSQPRAQIPILYKILSYREALPLFYTQLPNFQKFIADINKCNISIENLDLSDEFNVNKIASIILNQRIHVNSFEEVLLQLDELKNDTFGMPINKVENLKKFLLKGVSFAPNERYCGIRYRDRKSYFAYDEAIDAWNNFMSM